jgi:hypothetical protein
MSFMLDVTASRGSRSALLTVSVVLLVLCGCNRGPATAQVRGKVLYKDGSVPKGGVRVVRFEPAQDTTAEIRKAASGQIESDGSFQLATRVPGDGVFLGKYVVTFAVWKGPRDPTSLIEEKYTNSSTSPYHVTVDDDIDDLMFEIEPIGGSPTAGAPIKPDLKSSGSPAGQ